MAQKNTNELTANKVADRLITSINVHCAFVKINTVMYPYLKTCIVQFYMHNAHTFESAHVHIRTSIHKS